MWYFRKRVPSDLIEQWGTTCVTKSLQTADRAEAMRRLHVEQVEFDRKASLLKASQNAAASNRAMRLSAADLNDIVQSWMKQQEAGMSVIGASSTSDDGLVERLEELDIEEHTLRSVSEASSVAIGQMVVQALAIAGYPMRQKRGPVTLGARNAGAPTFTLAAETNDQLRRLIRDGRLELLRAARQQLREGGPFTLGNVPSAPKSRRQYTLADLIREFSQDPSREARSAKTEQDYGMVFRLLREQLGEKTPIADITRDDCTELRRILMALPSNAAKKYPALTLAKAAQDAPNGVPRMKPATINSHLTKIGTIFKWAVTEQKLSSSPARALSVAETGRRSDDREGFTMEELRRIFSSPLFTGCVNDERGYARPGPNRPRRSRFWVPLIALFTGLRQNEICQLATDDIARVDGIDVVRVRAVHPWQHLKSTAAQRIVPIHPELARIGLLTYVQELRSRSEERMFPELKADGRGYMSGVFQKRFATFLTSVGIDDPKKVFHSFRHTWADAMRAAEVVEERRQVLGGWKGVGVDKLYGSGFPTALMADAISRLSYPNLDLRHLYQNEAEPISV